MVFCGSRHEGLTTRRRRLDGMEGVDFVRCRICGDHRRVISGRHLSKHGIDRQTYMEEYELSPDDLIAKAFRRIQSSRRDFKPYSKREWLDIMKAAYKRDPRFFCSGNFETEHWQLYRHGVWLFGSWDNALRAAGLDPQHSARCFAVSSAGDRSAGGATRPSPCGSV